MPDIKKKYSLFELDVPLSEQTLLVLCAIDIAITTSPLYCAALLTTCVFFHVVSRAPLQSQHAHSAS